ncbi:MAG: DUF11 domain-containing protein [Sphingomonadales bacterium]|nr:DUF11 domain-containing protein [Sphingomonadales bacterium]MDE2569773.1 DUF11 domain-containing protein [Sphingomonadales bacterium]
MIRFAPLRTALTVLVAAAAALAAVAPANAGSISNTAHATWFEGGQTYGTDSNTVVFDVAAKPVTLATFVAAPGSDSTMSYLPSICRGTAQSAESAAGVVPQAISANAVAGSAIHPGDTFYFRIDAPAANLDPNAIDTLTAEITTSGGDAETVVVRETGANTGQFIGAMPTQGVPPALVQHDCRLSIAGQQTVSISVHGNDSTARMAITSLDVLADPFGYVFDSEDGSPVDGAVVTLVDALTGAPAKVFAPDGVTGWPATVTTGGLVTDASGATFQLDPGEYRFPLTASGSYRVVVKPPQPYTAPSGVGPTQFAGLTKPGGGALQISDASYGRAFPLTSEAPIQVDVPVDRPAVAVSLVKSASRDRAQPGDVVFYTITATNPDAGHAKLGVVVIDRPSSELRLRKDSIRIDGAQPAAGSVTAAPDGHRLTISLGTLAPAMKRTITYAMTVLPGASAGQALNTAQVADQRGLNAFASAVVRIDPDPLAGRMTLIGRVTAGGCSWDGDHPGLPGVRVMLEDGSFAITDADGRYHFDGLVPGDHVAAVAGQTLPEGGRFVNCARSTRNAGSATSRFVSGQGGSLAVADFAAEIPTEALKALIEANDARHRAEAVEEPQPGPVVAPAKPGEAPRLDTLDRAERAERKAAGADTDWLALGDGPPAFLFPGPDHNPRAPAVRVVIRHKPAQKVRLSVDGKPVPNLAFDSLKTAANGQWAVSMWRGIPIEGDVAHLTAEVVDPDGTVAAKLARDVHFRAIAVDARLVPGKSHLVADGRTRPVIAIQFLDRDGKPVHAGVSGDFQLNEPYESAAAVDAMQARALTGQGHNTPHWTVDGDDGVALIELAPTMVSGALQLDFNFIDGQQRRKRTLNAWVVPGDQKWTLVGLAEGSVGTRTIADAMERTGRFDSDLGDNARVAFYAKGRVPGSALLTLAYDSGKQRDDQQLLGAIDPRAYYTVFADGSNRRFDAASRDKLYVRIESRAFYALFGDFEAGFNQTRLTRYQRTATGVKAEARLGGLHAQGFAARIASAHRHDEIQGAGISGPYALSSRAIIANSETVVIETRDRFRPEIVVSSRTLTRFVDYDIDLLSGTITFKSPVLSRDFDQNPNFIVLDYEIDQNSSGGPLNAGARVDYTTTDGRLRVGATAVSDTGNGARTTMAGMDLKARVSNSTELRAELAGSRAGGTTRNAWLAEIERHDGRLDLLAYARSMDQGYGVGQSTGAEQGRRKFGLDARYRFTEALSVTTSAWLDDSLSDATHREAFQLQGEYRRGQDTFRGGISTLRDHLADGTLATSTTLDGGVSRKFLNDKLEVEATASVALGKAESVDLPSREQLTLRYALNSSVRLIGSYEIAKGSQLDTRMARAGFELTPWRGGRVVTTLGRQDIAELGTRSFAAFGLAQSFDLTHHLSIDATLDSNRALGGISSARLVNLLQPAASGGFLSQAGTITEDFTAVTLGGNWRAKRWTASLRGEWRDGEFAKRRGMTFGAIRQMGEGAVFGSGVTWTRASGLGGQFSEVIDGAVALANRPADHSFAMLAKLEFRSDYIVNAMNGSAGAAGQTALNVDGTARATRAIGSVSFNLSPRTRHDDAYVQRSEIGLFVAMRYTFDRYQDYNLAASAVLGGIDAHVGIGSRVEIGGSATVRTMPGDGVTQFALGPTIGVVPARDVLLTVGYNVTGFRDRDFSASRNTSKGVFVALKAKFDTSTLSFLGLGR